MSRGRRDGFRYSFSGAIVGGTFGAIGGTVIGFYLGLSFEHFRYYQMRDYDISLSVLAIPAFLALGAGLGAYLGGRIFGKSD